MKKTSVVLIFISIFTCLLVLSSRHVTFAYWESEEGRIYVTGWLENLTSVRLDDRPSAEPPLGYDGSYDAGDIQTFRNTLYIETNVKLSSNLDFFAISRAWWDASTTLDINDLPDIIEDEHASHRGPDMDSNIDLREWYLTARAGDFTVKIGRQQVIWGEADNIRIADVINPLDVSWHYTFESWEDIRIPLRMVNVMYEPNTENQFRLQLIWIPEDYRAWYWAPEGAPWALPIPGLQMFWDQQGKELPDRHDFSNGEFGARIQATVGDWELSLFDFYSRVDNAVWKLDFGYFPIPYKFEWPRTNIIGGTFNVFNNLTGTVFRGECAYTMDQPYTSALLNEIIEKDTVAFMLGFDRPTMWTWINRRSFFISGQFYHKRILDYDSNIVSTDMSTDKTQSIVSLLINTTYRKDTIIPQFVGVVDFSGNGFLQPSIKYEPSDLWEITLSANFIYGSSDDDGYYGPMRRNSEIFTRLRIKF